MNAVKTEAMTFEMHARLSLDTDFSMRFKGHQVYSNFKYLEIAILMEFPC